MLILGLRAVSRYKIQNKGINYYILICFQNTYITQFYLLYPPTLPSYFRARLPVISLLHQRLQRLSRLCVQHIRKRRRVAGAGVDACVM